MNDKEFPELENAEQPVNSALQPTSCAQHGKCNINQLQYLLFVVMEGVWRHDFAWPFKKPIDAVKLKLPDYHSVIKYPMDFGTIKSKLKNYCYSSAEECIKDIKLVFGNCYAYTDEEEDVVIMAKVVEKLFNKMLNRMPRECVLHINGSLQPSNGAQDVKSSTNQLQYLLNVVMEAVWEHKSAVKFQQLTNAVNRQLQNHSSMIKYPMDLGTIKKKLENCCYSSAKECIQDFNTVFKNCYEYIDNHKRKNAMLITEEVKELFCEKLNGMPHKVVEIPISVMLSQGEVDKEKAVNFAPRGTKSSSVASGKNSGPTTSSTQSSHAKPATRKNAQLSAVPAKSRKLKKNQD